MNRENVMFGGFSSRADQISNLIKVGIDAEERCDNSVSFFDFEAKVAKRNLVINCSGKIGGKTEFFNINADKENFCEVNQKIIDFFHFTALVIDTYRDFLIKHKLSLCKLGLSELGRGE